MKVGFIIGPQGISWQGTYYDKFALSKNRPWLDKVSKKYWIHDSGGKVTLKNRKNPETRPNVRVDVAVAYACKYLMPEITWDFIPAHEITDERIQKNDLVINQFMDLLIVPFIRKFKSETAQRRPHAKLNGIYSRNKDKLYPPIDYANTIYDKCKYYDHFKDRKLPIAPTLCISKKQYMNDPKAAALKLEKFKSSVNTPLFAKPVHGTDAIGAQFLKNETKAKDFSWYFRKIFKNPQFPGIVFQKYMADFEKTVPQIRFFFVGNRLNHVILNYRGKDYIPTQMAHLIPNRTKSFKLMSVPNIKIAKFLALKAKNSMKKYMDGLPQLITRIDLGCCLKLGNRNTFFINEIEFNPGLYLHADKNKFNFDMKCAKIIQKVIQKKLKTKQ